MTASHRPDRPRAVVGVVAFVGLLVVVPWMLVRASSWRFGSANPLAGVAPPWRWPLGDVLGDRLTDDVLVDVVVRGALVVAWIALATVVTTVVAETIHMVRHDGLSMPSVRGLSWSQPLARSIAACLLVVLPLVANARVAARSVHVPVRDVVSPATVEVHDHEVSTVLVDRPPAHPPVATTPAAPADGVVYVVRPGDSVYAIAERFAGTDPASVVRLAEQILDLNLGTSMPDGQRFTNAAYIEPGWRLRLPAGVATAIPAEVASPVDGVAPPAADLHVVEPGDTLSGIAAERLGDAARWDELWEANRGAEMGDGRTFDDPDLILPGWAVRVPADASAPASPPAEPTPPVTAPSAPTTVAPAPTATTPTTITTPTIPTPTAPATSASATTTSPAVTTTSATTTATTSATTSTTAPATTTTTSTPVGGSGSGAGDGAGDPADRPAPAPIGLGHAGMLSAGVLALLAVRRRQRLRRARPRARVPAPRPGPVATERRLRTIDASERLVRVDLAIRAVAPTLVAAERHVVAVLVDAVGSIEVVLSGECDLPAPWGRHGRADRWLLASGVPLELLAEPGRSVGTPCLALVQLGVALHGREVYVDLEALGVLAIEAGATDADAVVSGIASTLGTSVFAEVATLAGVGVDPVAFVGHRNHTDCVTVDEALDLAAAAIGSTAGSIDSTFALRARRTSAEPWEPAVVLVSSRHAVPTEVLEAVRPGHGLAVVVAGPSEAAGAWLRPDGGTWRLDPLGIELVPVGLSPTDLVAIDELVGDAAEPLSDADDADAPVEPVDPAAVSGEGFVEQDWALMVRLLGPVDVVDRDGTSVPFERSKTRELVAWLATHRETATRAGARTAMWELDVRDATFANVVSEARRTMARLVPPPAATEWLGRTLTEELPLHPAVVTDAELVRARLAAARVQPPALAISTLTPAVELVRGLPFEGTAYLWPDAEGITSDLVLLATTVAAELAAHHLSVGDVDGVFAATAAGLRVLPGHEELIALRMRAHARAGDHAGVRHEWESYERVITTDPWSDGEPAPKLVALRRELLAAR